ncbi:MAG: IclR family transcriptional regulator [Thermomicrobium sp.]|nr:IclR family transcriptional regulator [Thermomicrobium sp.]
MVGHSPSVARAVAVLNALARSSDGLTLSALARELREPKSTLHGVLAALVEAGLLVRDEATKRYRLGAHILALAGAYARQSDLLRAFSEVARPLARELGETIQLAILQGREVLYIGKQEGTQWVRLASEVGTRLPAQATSLGKCLLAWLPPDELDRLLAEGPLVALTPRTITDPDVLRAELAQVRERGYAIDRGETLSDVWCFGAPIRDAHGAVVAAVSISVPVTRITPERVDELIAAVRRAAAELSHRLGYSDIARESVGCPDVRFERRRVAP